MLTSDQKEYNYKQGTNKTKVLLIENATPLLLYYLDNAELRQWPVVFTLLGFKHHHLQGSAKYLVTDGYKAKQNQ